MFFDDFDDPGPCPVCGAAQGACTGEDDSAGIGVTRGIVIRQLPGRDAVMTDAAAVEALPAPSPASPRAARRARVKET